VTSARRFADPCDQHFRSQDSITSYVRRAETIVAPVRARVTASRSVLTRPDRGGGARQSGAGQLQVGGVSERAQRTSGSLTGCRVNRGGSPVGPALEQCKPIDQLPARGRRHGGATGREQHARSASPPPSPPSPRTIAIHCGHTAVTRNGSAPPRPCSSVAPPVTTRASCWGSAGSLSTGPSAPAQYASHAAGSDRRSRYRTLGHPG
jgi:hypothetical protein